MEKCRRLTDSGLGLYITRKSITSHIHIYLADASVKSNIHVKQNVHLKHISVKELTVGMRDELTMTGQARDTNRIRARDI